MKNEIEDAVLINDTVQEPRDLKPFKTAASPNALKNGVDLGETKENGELPAKSNWLRQVIIGIGILAVLAGAGAYYIQQVLPFETTDDAIIEGHVTTVSPQISGRIEKLLVEDNQEVKSGEILAQIDPSDYQSMLEQARANLAASKSRLEQARAQFTVDQAKIEEEKANVIASQAEAKRAAADSKRFQAIGPAGVSQSEMDLAATHAHASEAQSSAARSKVTAAEAAVTLDEASIAVASADIQKNEALVRQAELNLTYTRITAPQAGLVTHRTVEKGAYVQPGQSLLAIVPRKVWVIANFKETQLTRMRPGQPVELKMDAYPKLKLTGHVESIQSGAGAHFSLFPPENSSGNYVKVVQRVPVKITLDEVADSNVVFGPGMSIEPKVRVK